jgi:hypothetical protein
VDGSNGFGLDAFQVVEFGHADREVGEVVVADRPRSTSAAN